MMAKSDMEETDPLEGEPESAQVEGLAEEPAEEAAAPMEGYMLCLKVQPGRMTVCKKPLEPDVEPVEGALPGATYEEIDVDTIEQGLKAILKFYKDDPVDDSEDAHMTAAYGDSQPVNVNEKAGY